MVRIDVREELKELALSSDIMRLDTIDVDLGSAHTALRRISLRGFIVGWIERVLKFRLDMDESIQSEVEIWNEHDFVGSLFWRDFLERALQIVPCEVGPVARAATTRVDHVFLDYTDPGYRDVLLELARTRTDTAAWWWDRAPKSGPVLVGLTGNHSSLAK